MNKKRGVLLIAILFVVVLSFSVSAVDYIECDDGSQCSPGEDCSTVDCVVSTSQPITFSNSNNVEFEYFFKSFKLTEGILTFKNDGAPVYPGYNDYDEINAEDPCDTSPCDQGKGQQGQSGGGAGGTGGYSYDKGGAGGGGGAGGPSGYKGSQGGRGGDPYDCTSPSEGEPQPVAEYAGANIKIRTIDFIEIVGGSIFSEGDAGSDGDGPSGKCKDRKAGASGGTGGAGGGTITLVSNIIQLKKGTVDLSGGAGGSGGEGDNDAGITGGNDDGGSGGGAGGGAGGSLILRYTGSQPPIVDDANFKFISVGGSKGTSPSVSNCKDNTCTGESGTKGNDGVFDKTGNHVTLNELNPDGDVVYLHKLFLCSDTIDNEGNGKKDMEDQACIDECRKDRPNNYVTSHADNYNISARNFEDGCCGDDIYRCSFKSLDDYEKYLLKQQSYFDDCFSIVDKDECVLKTYCEWEGGDDGSIIETSIGTILRCGKSGDSWTKPDDASLNPREIMTAKINDATSVSQYSDGDYWYTCNADGKNLLNAKSQLVSNFGMVDSAICVIDGYSSKFIGCDSSYLQSRECQLNLPDNECLSNPSLLRVFISEEDQKKYLGPGETWELVFDDDTERDWNQYSKIHLHIKTTGTLEKIDQGGSTLISFSDSIHASDDFQTVVRDVVPGDAYEPTYSNVRKFVFTASEETEITINSIWFEKDVSGTNKFAFCSSNEDDEYAWITDLDSPYGMKACNALEPYGWVGACCGDDGNEYYTSLEDGACWNSKPLKPNSLTSDNRTLAYTDGVNPKFVSCGGQGLPDSYEDDGLGVPDFEIVEPGQCKSYAGYVCTNEGWVKYSDDKYCEAAGEDDYCTDIREDSNDVVGYVPPIEDDDSTLYDIFHMDYVDVGGECCPNGGCWDGYKCRKETYTNDGLICMAGKWVDVYTARDYDPYEDLFNFCEEDECFVGQNNFDSDHDLVYDAITDTFDGDLCLHTYYSDKDNMNRDTGCAPGEDEETPPYIIEGISDVDSTRGMCVSQNYIYKNYKCLLGDWTSKTAYIAAHLLNFIGEEGLKNYTLVCDDAERSLLDGYRDNPLPPNNICVLEYKGDSSDLRIAGTSFDTYTDLDSFLSTLSGVYDGELCLGVFESEEEDNYFECDESTGDTQVAVWANPYLNSLLVTRYNSYNPLSLSDWGPIFNEFVRDPIGTIVDILKGEVGSSPYLGSRSPVIFPESKLDKIYISKKGNRMIEGYIREPVRVEDVDSGHILTVQYINVSTDICAKVEGLKHDDDPTFEFLCQASVDDDGGWKFNLASKRSHYSYSLDFWDELTTSIRLEDVGGAPDFIAITVEQPDGMPRPYSGGTSEFSYVSMDPKYSQYSGSWRFYDKATKDDYTELVCADDVTDPCEVSFSENADWYGEDIIAELTLVNGDDTRIVEREFTMNTAPEVEINEVSLDPQNILRGLYDRFDEDGDDITIDEQWFDEQEQELTDTQEIVPGESFTYKVTASDGMDFAFDEIVQTNEGYCGDGYIITDAGELCDNGTTLNGKVCGPDYGEDEEGCDYCNADCTEIIHIDSPFCGDGKIDKTYGELCDTDKLDGRVCSNFVDNEVSFTDGVIGCFSNCTFDTTQCTTNTDFICENRMFLGATGCTVAGQNNLCTEDIACEETITSVSGNVVCIDYTTDTLDCDPSVAGACSQGCTDVGPTGEICNCRGSGDCSSLSNPEDFSECTVTTDCTGEMDCSDLSEYDCVNTYGAVCQEAGEVQSTCGNEKCDDPEDYDNGCSWECSECDSDDLCELNEYDAFAQSCIDCATCINDGTCSINEGPWCPDCYDINCVGDGCMYRVGTCSYGFVIEDNCLGAFSPVPVVGSSGDRCMCA